MVSIEMIKLLETWKLNEPPSQTGISEESCAAEYQFTVNKGNKGKH